MSVRPRSDGGGDMEICSMHSVNLMQEHGVTLSQVMAGQARDNSSQTQGSWNIDS